MKNFKQLYTNSDLSEGQIIHPVKDLSKRLSRVLRLKSGDKVALFNGRDGLFEAEILDDKAVELKIVEQLKPFPEGCVQSTLMVALVKKNAMDLIFRQATEMGVTHIQPVLTDFTVVDKLNIDRIESILVEAAEQCERLDVPQLLPIKKLETAISAFEKQVYWAAEQVGGKFGQYKTRSGDAILVGPEGGFSEKERAFLEVQKKVSPVGLGCHILRADTAIVAAMSRFFDHLK